MSKRDESLGALRKSWRKLNSVRAARDEELEKKLQRSKEKDGDAWLGVIERMDLRKREREERGKWERDFERKTLKNHPILGDYVKCMRVNTLPFRPSNLDALRDLAEEVFEPLFESNPTNVQPEEVITLEIDKNEIPWWKVDGSSSMKTYTMIRGKERKKCFVPGSNSSLTPEENEAKVLEYFKNAVYEEIEDILTDNSPEPVISPIEDMPGMVSMRTVTEDCLKAAGLTEEIHRLVIVFEYNDDYQGSLVEAVEFFTERINRRDVGEPITGLLLYYDRVAIDMIEGGELHIMYFLKEITESGNFLRLRMGRCRVLGTYQHSGKRLFPGGHFNLTIDNPPDPMASILGDSETQGEEKDDEEKEQQEEQEEEEEEDDDDDEENEADNKKTSQKEWKQLETKMVSTVQKLKFLWTYLNALMKENKVKRKDTSSNIEKDKSVSKSLTIPNWMASQLPSVAEVESYLDCKLLETIDEYAESLLKVPYIEEFSDLEKPPLATLIPFNVIHPQFGEDEAGRTVDSTLAFKPRRFPIYSPKGYPVLDNF